MTTYKISSIDFCGNIVNANYLNGKIFKQCELVGFKDVIPGYKYELLFGKKGRSPILIEKRDANVESTYTILNLTKDIISIFNKINPFQSTDNYTKGGIYMHGNNQYYILDISCNGKFRVLNLTTMIESDLVIFDESFYINPYVAYIYLSLYGLLYLFGFSGYENLKINSYKMKAKDYENLANKLVNYSNSKQNSKDDDDDDQTNNKLISFIKFLDKNADDDDKLTNKLKTIISVCDLNK